MTRDEITTRARKIIADHYACTAGREAPEITDDMPLIGGGSHLGAFADGDLDSLDHMEIVLALEEAFDIEIGDDVAEAMKTFGQAIDWLAARVMTVSADDEEICIACDVAFKEGDMVLGDVSGGCIHVACCGPEREGYVKDLDSGEPLGPDDPIPTGYAWSKWPQAVIA